MPLPLLHTRASGVLAKRNQALAASLQSAALGTAAAAQQGGQPLSTRSHDSGGTRAPPELAEMHQVMAERVTLAECA